MLTTAAFATSALHVFNAVFGGEARLLEYTRPHTYPLSDDERIVASVPFGSDAVSGYAFLVLHEADIRHAAEQILRRFAIRTPVEDRAIFAELMNIYVANLAGKLLPEQAGVDIGVPDPIPACGFPQAETIAVVRLRTEENIPFAFVYTINAKEA